MDECGSFETIGSSDSSGFPFKDLSKRKFCPLQDDSTCIYCRSIKDLRILRSRTPLKTRRLANHTALLSNSSMSTATSLEEFTIESSLGTCEAKTTEGSDGAVNFGTSEGIGLSRCPLRARLKRKHPPVASKVCIRRENKKCSKCGIWTNLCSGRSWETYFTFWASHNMMKKTLGEKTPNSSHYHLLETITPYSPLARPHSNTLSSDSACQEKKQGASVVSMNPDMLELLVVWPAGRPFFHPVDVVDASLVETKP